MTFDRKSYLRDALEWEHIDDVRKLQEQELDTAFAKMRFMQAQEVRDAEYRLRRDAEQAQYTLARLLERLDNDGGMEASLNSLGELQGQAANVEAAVGQLHAAREALRRMDAAYEVQS
jgi:hypothetical protein